LLITVDEITLLAFMALKMEWGVTYKVKLIYMKRGEFWFPWLMYLITGYRSWL